MKDWLHLLPEIPLTDWYLAVVGSRNFYDYDLLKQILAEWVDHWGTPTAIVTGEASGADTLARRWARENGIKPYIFDANWVIYGKSAGFRRNKEIVTEATHMIAFPSHSGSGTQHSIRLAEAKRIPVIIHFID